MYEVEAKVHLSRPSRKRVLALLSRIAKKKGVVTTKKDTYYEAGPSFFLRIRSSGRKAVFNLKIKKRKQGIESNQEIEWPLKNDAKFSQWLKKWGIPKIAEKEKKSMVYNLPPFTIELNHVKGLGDYLEIEIMVRTIKEVPAAQKKLKDFFKKLGFMPHQFEKRYYLELLREKQG